MIIILPAVGSGPQAPGGSEGVRGSLDIRRAQGSMIITVVVDNSNHSKPATTTTTIIIH